MSLGKRRELFALGRDFGIEFRGLLQGLVQRFHFQVNRADEGVGLVVVHGCPDLFAAFLQALPRVLPVAVTVIVLLFQVGLRIGDLLLQPLDGLERGSDVGLGLFQVILGSLLLFSQVLQHVLAFWLLQAGDDVAAHGAAVALMQRLVGLLQQIAPVSLAFNSGAGLFLERPLGLECGLQLLEFLLLLA